MAAADDDFIQVHARFRPLLGERELAGGGAAWQLEEDAVSLDSAALGRKELRFDGVFGSGTRNGAVYDRVARRVVDNVLDGYNGTVLAYGQTGSGKTFSIFGDPKAKEYGLLEHAVRDLFKGATGANFLLRMSYMEIYNEKVFDLLGDGSTGPQEGLKIARDDPVLGVVMQDLKEVIVHSPEAVLELIAEGERSRHFRSTAMNERSSRSHSIFRLVVEHQLGRGRAKSQCRAGGEEEEKEEDEEDEEGKAICAKREDEDNFGSSDGEVVVSCLSFVDLAGSERQSNARTSGAALQEGSNINKSLLALREVISKLTAGRPGSHVPYRNSKLTRILRQALGGNARTALICTVSPSLVHMQESVNTLHFGVLCKRVRNSAQQNTVGADSALIAKYRKQVEHLKRDLEEERARADALRAEMEHKTKLTQAGAGVALALGLEQADRFTKWVVRAQRWWRRKELRRLRELREAAASGEARAKQLAEQLESLQAKGGSARRLSLVVHSQGTAQSVLQFARKMRAAVPDDTAARCAALQAEVQALRDGQAQVAEAQAQAVRSWEADMAAWYDKSEAYNRETDERASIVEREAARLEAERAALDSRAEALASRENELAAAEAALQARVESLAAEKAECLVADFAARRKALAAQEERLHAAEAELPARAQALASQQLAALRQGDTDELYERLRAMERALQAREVDFGARLETCEARERAVAKREAEVAVAREAVAGHEGRAAELRERALDVLLRERQVRLAEQDLASCGAALDARTADLAAREEAVHGVQSVRAQAAAAAQLRKDTLEAREGAVHAVRCRLQAVLLEASPALDVAREQLAAWERADADMLPACEVRAVCASLLRLLASVGEALQTAALAGELSREMDSLATAAGGRAGLCGDTRRLGELAARLGDILKVAVPLVAGCTVAPDELRFRRRLLARHLSDAKVVLLAAQRRRAGPPSP